MILLDKTIQYILSILEMKKERCTKQEIIFPVTLRVRYLSIVKRVSLLMLIHSGQVVKLSGFSFYILEVNVKQQLNIFLRMEKRTAHFSLS